MVEPDTVHTVAGLAAKLTGRPDEAVALSAAGVVPIAALASGAKVMVWLGWVTVKLWLTGGAAE
jgi:hypothetical protein